MTILTKSTFRGVLFLYFLLNWCNWHSCCDFSRLQMWLQFDEVNYLKKSSQSIRLRQRFETLHGSHHGVFFWWFL